MSAVTTPHSRAPHRTLRCDLQVVRWIGLVATPPTPPTPHKGVLFTPTLAMWAVWCYVAINIYNIYSYIFTTQHGFNHTAQAVRVITLSLKYLLWSGFDRAHPVRRAKRLEAALAAAGELQRALILELLHLDHQPTRANRAPQEHAP